MTLQETKAMLLFAEEIHYNPNQPADFLLELWGYNKHYYGY